MVDLEDLFRAISRNKAAAIPYFEKLENHRRLVDQLQAAIEKQRLWLESAAFGEIEPVIVNDPIGAVRQAIKDNDPLAIKAAALAGYKSNQINAVRVAAEFDQDISKLVDHLQTYGELASLNQRVFMRFALAEPEGKHDRMPQLR